VAGFAVLALLGVGMVSPAALVGVVLDLLSDGLIVVPPMLAGAWLVPVFGCGKLPLRWHFLIGASLGLGVLCLSVLALGVAGLLDQRLWVVILACLMVVGCYRWYSLLSGANRCETEAEAESGGDHKGWMWLWWAALPFAVLALLAASTAPGFIWSEEGYGYDVLEYHLQMPKEYYEAGQIQYAAHNVYASFPSNVEMLYLLAMVVLDDVEDVGTVANVIHLAFAVLTVFAAWAVGREWSREAGAVCGVCAGTTGWLVYLSGLAYVENGMLFWGTVGCGLLLRSLRDTERSDGVDGAESGGMHSRPFGLAVVAGAAAGFACGCKYTAVPLIAAPLALVPLFRRSRATGRRIGASCVFAGAAVVTFLPWLAKNQAMTGNPVFPLANSVFAASPSGWGPEETERWDRGHSLDAGERTIGGRVGLLFTHVLWDKHQRLGPVVLLLAALGMFRRRRSDVDFALLMILALQLAVWLFATHLYARFAVVLLIPLSLLAGRSVLVHGARTRRTVIAAALVFGAAWNGASALDLLRREGAAGAPAALIYEGQLPGYEYFKTVNAELPEDAKVLLVGEARAFYFQRKVDYCVAFNRSPFLDLVSETDDAGRIADWLRERGYSHVLVNWGELRRLASTYGFSPYVEPGRLEALFEQLSREGVVRVRGYAHPSSSVRYVELWEVAG
jgi:hypothetical protein